MGSSSSSFSTRLSSAFSIRLSYFFRSFPFFGSSMVTSPVRISLRSRNPSQFCSVGVPTMSKMRPSCSISVLPVRRGRPRMSSARMQPADQMSTAQP